MYILSHLVASLVFRFQIAYRSLLSLLFSEPPPASASTRFSSSSSSPLFSKRPCLTYFYEDDPSYSLLKRYFEERGVHCMTKQLQQKRRDEIEPLLPPFSAFPVLEANGMVVSDRKTILRYADDVAFSETSTTSPRGYEPLSRLCENHWIEMHAEFVSPMKIVCRMKAASGEGEGKGEGGSKETGSSSLEGWIVYNHAPAYLRYLDDHLSGSNPVFHLIGWEESTADTFWSETLFDLLYPPCKSSQNGLHRKIASMIEERFPNVKRYTLRRKEMEDDDASTTSSASFEREEREDEGEAQVEGEGDANDDADEPEIMHSSDIDPAAALNKGQEEEEEAKKDI